jgi:hypothetical protein
MAFRILLPSGTHVATVDSREQAEADADFYAAHYSVPREEIQIVETANKPQRW